jgi:hypothetical protein
MKLTDAVNEIVPLTLKDVAVNVNDNKLIFTDEFGTMVRIFTDDDPDLKMKVNRYWADFLQHRSHKLNERMKINDTTEQWYEVHIDEPFAASKRCDTMKEVTEEVKRFHEQQYNGVKVFYFTKMEINPEDEIEEDNCTKE